MTCHHPYNTITQQNIKEEWIFCGHFACRAVYGGVVYKMQLGIVKSSSLCNAEIIW